MPPDAVDDGRLQIVTPEGVTLALDVAGVGSRFTARLLDTLIQVGVIFALGITFGAVSGDASAWSYAILSLVAFGVFFLYDVVFELAASGRTPGKMASGLRVVDNSGGAAGAGRIVVRNLLRLVDFLPALYGVGLLTMLMTKHSRRLGDLAAGTLVVRDRAGDRSTVQLGVIGSQVTVSSDLVAAWDVSAIDARELAVIESFLARRLALKPHVRDQIGRDLALRLAPRVTGLPSTSHPEYVLEGIVVAKRMRS